MDRLGPRESTEDANGHFVTNVYDSMGRLQFVKNALGENARQYGYDLAGRMVTYADAADRVRTYSYDAAGQNTAIQFPDGKIATYAFDSLGRRTTMTDWHAALAHCWRVHKPKPNGGPPQTNLPGSTTFVALGGVPHIQVGNLLDLKPEGSTALVGDAPAYPYALSHGHNGSTVNHLVNTGRYVLART